LSFNRKGQQSKPPPVQVVVGETVPLGESLHRRTRLPFPVVQVERQAAVPTEVIRPGEFKDVCFDIALP